MQKQQQRGLSLAGRNSSLELLRIITMLMIVLHHVCLHSGFVVRNLPLSFNRLFLQWGVLGNLGVDIFVMISGYFLCTKDNPAKSLGKLFVQVWFYSIGLFIVSRFGFGYSYSLKEMLKAFMPTVFMLYWFFTVYVFLIIISPFINKYLQRSNRHVLQRVLAVLVFFVVLIPTFTNKRIYGAQIPQFILFYLIGAYFRKYPDNCFQQKKNRMVITFCSFAFLFLSTVVIELIGTKNAYFAQSGKYFYGRDSIVVVGCALGMFTNAVYAKPFYNRFINTVAGCTFGVYLIHDNAVFRKILWKQLLPNAEFADDPSLVLRMLCSTVIVFVCSVGIEFLRQKTVAKPMLSVYDKITGYMIQRAKPSVDYFTEKFRFFSKKQGQ